MAVVTQVICLVLLSCEVCPKTVHILLRLDRHSEYFGRDDVEIGGSATMGNGVVASVCVLDAIPKACQLCA
jgi:hypothetical protein